MRKGSERKRERKRGQKCKAKERRNKMQLKGEREMDKSIGTKI
jgi:hypothetical protein